MKSDYAGGPLPSPPASHTTRLESLLSFSSPDWSILEGSAGGIGSQGKTWPREAAQTQTEGDETSYLTLYFGILPNSNVLSDGRLNYHRKKKKKTRIAFFHFVKIIFPGRVTTLTKRWRSWETMEGASLEVTFFEQLLYARNGLRKFIYSQTKQSWK